MQNLQRYCSTFLAFTALACLALQPPTWVLTSTVMVLVAVHFGNTGVWGFGWLATNRAHLALPSPRQIPLEKADQILAKLGETPRINPEKARVIVENLLGAEVQGTQRSCVGLRHEEVVGLIQKATSEDLDACFWGTLPLGQFLERVAPGMSTGIMTRFAVHPMLAAERSRRRAAVYAPFQTTPEA